MRRFVFELLSPNEVFTSRPRSDASASRFSLARVRPRATRAELLLLLLLLIIYPSDVGKRPSSKRNEKRKARLFERKKRVGLCRRRK